MDDLLDSFYFILFVAGFFPFKIIIIVDKEKALKIKIGVVK